MADGRDAGTDTKPPAKPAPSDSIQVNLQLSAQALKMISDLSEKLRTPPAEVLGEALTFYSAVKEAHDDGGTVIVPSGVTRSKFNQEIQLP